MLPIVGIAGTAGSGKGVISSLLIEEFGFTEVNLADPSKRHCQDVFRFSDEQLWGDSSYRNAPDTRYPRQHGPYVDTLTGSKCRCCGESASSIKRCYLTPRFALQTLCGEWGRICFEDLYARTAVDAAKELASNFNMEYLPSEGLFSIGGTVDRKGVIIPDIRYDNERRLISKAGGKCILITGRESSLSEAQAAHASESTQWKSIDFYAVVRNTGSLEELKITVGNIVSAFL